MELTPEQIRVLGCLIEKQRTTPESYPLTVNSLRLACNQSTNRDPVLDLDEATVRDAAAALGRRRLVRLASGQGSRATKYRHVANEALDLGDAELAVLAILMLRGTQTPGELKARADRLHAFEGLDAVHAVLDRLTERELVARLDRRPGQKEERYEQLLGGGHEAEAPAGPAGQTGASAQEVSGVPAPGGLRDVAGAHGVDAAPSDFDPAHDEGLERRVTELEADVRSLRETLDSLRRELGEPSVG